VFVFVCAFMNELRESNFFHVSLRVCEYVGVFVCVRG
jgi:hypothetical protein